MDVPVALQVNQGGTWLLTIWRSVINTCVLVAWSLFSSASLSGELLELSVAEADGEYKLRMVSVLDAPADHVYRVITDYTHAYRINPSLTELEFRANLPRSS